MPVTVVVGGQYGSEGKGKMTSHLAAVDSPAAVVRCGGPNAGHTTYIDGQPYVLRQLPAAVRAQRARLLIAAGAIVDPTLLLQEVELHGVSSRLGIDAHAAILSDTDRAAEERSCMGRRIASTLSGTGSATSRKVLRDANVVLAKDVAALRPWLTDVAAEVNSLHDGGQRVVVEGTQGFGLSLHHGDEYPFRTSRDTTAAGFLSEVGISPVLVDMIVMVVRTYPIRVGGNSGPFRTTELSWNELRDRSGYPHEILERTSVSKTVRRVAEFDSLLVRRAAQLNRPTHIAIHGLDYLDYRNFGCRSYEELTESARAFVIEIEQLTHASASFLFTGPPEEFLIDRRSRS